MATITGSAAPDSLTGSAQDDSILGLAGDDTLVASLGRDTLDGGAGFDEARLVAVGSQIRGWVADLASGAAFAEGSRHASLLSIEALYGSKNGDRFDGDANANRLDGAAGPDTLSGAAGDDGLFGGTEDDRLAGGPGADLLDGGAGFDSAAFDDEARPLVADLQAGRVLVWGGGPQDIDTLVNIEALIGGTGNDQLFGDAAGNRLDGGAGDDALHGRDGNDTLAGSAGPETPAGSAGHDTLDGGQGIDTLDLGGWTLPVTVQLGEGAADGSAEAAGALFVLRGLEWARGGQAADRLTGNADANRLEGGAGADTLHGAAGADTLVGGEGADLLQGGDGDDRIDLLSDGDRIVGGAGFDTLYLSFATGDFTHWTVNLATGEFSASNSQAGSLASGRASFDGVEALYASKGQSLLIGDDGDNLLRGSTVDGGRGNDTLMGSVVSYRGQTAPIHVEADADDPTSAIVRLGEERDELVGFHELWLGGGDDRFVGPSLAQPSVGYFGYGAFVLRGIDGGAGDDHLTGGSVLTGGAGNDTLEAAVASWSDSSGPVHADLRAGSATGADGIDTLIDARGAIGSPFDDTLVGSDGGDLLIGLGGDDRLDGGAGDDSLRGDGGRDTVLGGDGDDRVELWGAGTADGGAGKDAVFGHQNGWLAGGDGDDTIAGGSGSTLAGGAGNDLLRAQGGAALIDGGAGHDRLQLPYGSESYRVDLGAGTLTAPDGSVTRLVSIEAVVSAARPVVPPGALVPHSGTRSVPDTVIGGANVDSLTYEQPRADYRVDVRDAAAGAADVRPFARRSPDDTSVLPGDALQSIERLVFADQALAFGARALEVAQVAFALWSPAVAGSSTLFGKGIDFYDNGYTFDQLVNAALGWFTADSNEQLAARLVANVVGTRTVADVLALIVEGGGGNAGRAAATTALARDAANLAQIELAGFTRDGIVCALEFAGERLFDGG